MTTDTFPKTATQTLEIDGVEVRLSGIAKGSGMIAPDMATMLGFIFTDAAIDAIPLQRVLVHAVGPSFNSLTIDGDTSTSDTLLAFATGAAARRGQRAITAASGPSFLRFRKALGALLLDLAEQVARDGEGARKFVTVSVEGAASAGAAKRIALSIANSPLVKTAIAGEDANWGRIVAAIGKAGERALRDRIAIHFGPIRVAHEGARDPAYSEAETSRYMKNDRIDIRVELGLGRGRARVMTCDLTKLYVEINGDYRS
jgi:glutamate N-acetyltransferase/amino-acid N-acetyltransferase